MIKLGSRKLQMKGNGICLDIPAIWLRNTKLKIGDDVSVAVDDELRLIIVAGTVHDSVKRYRTNVSQTQCKQSKY